MCGYFCYCYLPVCFDQSGPSPLTSLINKAHRTAAHRVFFFCFLHRSLHTQEIVVLENPKRSVVSKILKPPCLEPTFIFTVKVSSIKFLPHSVIWSEKHLNLLIMPAMQFIHLVAATWLADNLY